MTSPGAAAAPRAPAAPKQAPAPAPAPPERAVAPALVVARVEREPETSTSEPATSSKRVLPAELQGRFREPKVLGAGGMGTVYQARDSILGRDVALKLLHPGNPNLDETLFREARSQAKLEHENVCKIYEVGSEGEHHYLVMQLIQGVPLDKARANLTLEQKVRIVRKIAAALHEVHRHGFVHRDIKPSNIMVELTEDGIYKPYLMDFGLAREVGAQGQTITGVLAGTPAFMAPEQARGEIRKLDRRTDVYSLGATLYDLLSGKPPFEAPDLGALLYQVQMEDARPLRSVDKTIPADVSAIVAKCLEKEPQHRYESAKALGDDLQRFLDGESVRRASIFFLAYKKAKQNKLAVLLATACLCAAAVLVAVWLRAQKAAERQAVFSRELGEDIKEMELFLRTAHELPTHDIERDRDIIRARLSKIQARMAAVGALGEGPGHYAIGWGHLALQDYEMARAHLQKAIDAGYTSPGLDYAMGMALGELYRKGLEEIKRIESPEKKKARLDEVNAELKEPALRRLNASLGGELSSPAYVKGLIALYAEDYEEAKRNAREAFTKEPWLYEAKKLEADAYFAEGSKYRHDGAFDYEKMMTYFRPAADAFAEAAEIGRSDPKVFLASCEFWRQMLSSAPNAYDAALPVFTKGAASCTQGIRSSPRAVEPRVYTALLYQIWAHKLIFSPGAPATDAARFMKEGVGMAREAAELGPSDPMAQYVHGTALLNEVYYNNDRGIDSLPAVNAAIESLAKATSLDPSFSWAHNELCKAQGEKLRLLSVRGLDPRPALSGAMEACDRAIALEPTWAFPHMAKAQAYLYQAMDQHQYGRAEESSFAAILRHAEEARKRSPNQRWVYGVLAKGHYYKALSETSQGRDPEGSLLMAEKAIEDLRAIFPDAESVSANTGLVATLRARRAALSGQDPGPLLAKAREALGRVMKSSPWDIDYRVYRARTEIVALSWAIKQVEAKESHFDEALAPLVPLLADDRAHPAFYQTMAEIHALRAKWLLSQKKSPDEAIRRGLEMADKALSIHPKMATVLQAKGRLLQARAKSLKDGPERIRAEEQAKQTFASAIEQNPSIERDADDDLFPPPRPPRIR
ncbi:serine/threonine-protein kinase [Polyangium sp. y55x31]|uniref:serine/threonine-protein kinase n=1 Tax=Polyangium sp. y55x31 TaxID=3042688 RepID=UPI002482B719|nr:serine/threonine-protein kinase [Polyangium sp. y55x31]MDI1477165.1 protein kinase [Polyangium sp. y55x31]